MRPLFACGFMLLVGCTAYSHYNERSPPKPPEEPSKASFEIRHPRGVEDVTVILALSGGGSRASYFSGSAMLALDELGLLDEVDAISAVSGGALPGAYYCITRDRTPEPSVKLERGLAGRLPTPASEKVFYDEATGRLTATAVLTADDRDQIAGRCFDDADREQVSRLLRLSQPVPSNRVWSPEEVRELMSNDYIARWYGNLLWPTNLTARWFTAYDRSDVMAQTFADNLFDVAVSGRDLTFAELNPERPNLILNATDATADHGGERHFGEVFTFTEEDFRERLDADIQSYPVAWGVMASACFPAAFSTMTLRDYSKDDEERYVHLLDGGSSDNLGLTSAKRIILEQESRPDAPRAYIVICVDAYTPSGADPEDADPRSLVDRAIDTNFLLGIDSLLATNRARMLDQFRTGRLFIQTSPDEAVGDARKFQSTVEPDLLTESGYETLERYRKDSIHTMPDGSVQLELDNLVFWHIQFDDIAELDTLGRQDRTELLEELHGIATNFSFDDKEEQTEAIDRAVKLIVTQDLQDVGRVMAVLEGE